MGYGWCHLLCGWKREDVFSACWSLHGWFVPGDVPSVLSERSSTPQRTQAAAQEEVDMKSERLLSNAIPIKNDIIQYCQIVNIFGRGWHSLQYWF
mmetsp:Transcript_29859/g.44142  ORF Transcript_29859/g.44142 Transcript_29859/m.44142 type:complete len:95 (-) Transcript_29859:206-490(-)